MCYHNGRFCIRTVMKVCHELGYTVTKSVRDENGTFHLWRIDDDVGKVIYFDFNKHISKFLTEKRKNIG